MNFDTTTYEQVIATVKEQLNIMDTTMHDSYFETQIDLGIKAIDGLRFTKTQTCEKQIIDGRMKLPAGHDRFLTLRLSEQGGCANAYLVNRRYLTKCGCDSPSADNYENTFSIQDGYIIFHHPQNIEDQTVEYSWIGRVMTDHGLYKMYEDYERPIIGWCCWKYALKNRHDFTAGIRREFQNEYIIAKGQVVARSHAVHAIEVREDVNAIMNGWVFSAEAYRGRP